MNQENSNGDLGNLYKTDLKVRVITINELSPEIAGFIESTHDREFGGDSMSYAIPQWYILGYLKGIPVTQVGVLQRTITINEKPFLVGGVSFLITEPQYRKNGFATIIVKEAISFIGNKLGLPFSLLTCKPRLEPLYSKMGWRSISEPNVFVQPTGNRSCGGLIMVYECGGIQWPDGRIDFCGFPW
jgi:hypothetical protein